MKYIKTYEKFSRPIIIGDQVKYIYKDSKWQTDKIYVTPASRDATYGDICEITDIKNAKGQLFVRAKNIKNNFPINLMFNKNLQYMPYNPRGSWLEFDKYFEHKLDTATSKYNL